MTQERPDGPPSDPVDAAEAIEEVDRIGPDDEQDEPPSAGDPAGVGEPGQVGEVDVAASDALAVAQMALSERTADLQRLQAEFVNYKRRVDRDRELLRQNATYSALAPIIEVLDTIDRAREHGPLDGGLKAVAEQLERAVAGLGLVKYGAVGDPFDPTIHEALSHIGEDPDVSVTTCRVIAKSGYTMGDRVVRAAQVLVVDPAPPAPAGPDEQPEEPDDAVE